MKYILILLLVLGVALADDDYDEYYSKKEGHYSKDLKYLNLNKSQKKSVKIIVKEFREKLKNFRALKSKVIQQKQKLFLSDNFDTNRIGQLNTTLSMSASEIEEIFLRKMHKILTKEQRNKFAWYVDEWEIE